MDCTEATALCSAQDVLDIPHSSSSRMVQRRMMVSSIEVREILPVLRSLSMRSLAMRLLMRSQLRLHLQRPLLKLAFTFSQRPVLQNLLRLETPSSSSTPPVWTLSETCSNLGRVGQEVREGRRGEGGQGGLHPAPVSLPGARGQRLPNTGIFQKWSQD